MADEPVATGTLAKTPLAHLLIYLDHKQLSGTLAVWPDIAVEGERKQDRVLFLKGRPVAGRLIEPAKTLREGLLKLFYRSEAPYAFYDTNLLGNAEERLNGRVDPLSLITESLRMTAREGLVDELVARVGKARLRIQPKTDLARFDFLPEERAIVDLLMAEPSTVEQLQAGTSLPAGRCKRLIYLLLISRAVAPYGEAPATSAAPAAVGGISLSAPDAAAVSPPAAVSGAPVAGGPPAAAPATSAAADDPTSRSPAAGLDRLADLPPPPPGLTPELTERWQRIVARGRLVENQNYFEMLGIDKNSQTPDVKGEFFKLAKDYHPDRLPPELAPLRGCVEVIFGYLNEAHKVLGDEEQRLAYLRSVREGGGTPAAERLMQQILDSAIAYERVQVFARKHQYDEALDVIQKILTITKDEPDYHAMHAWLLMHKFPGNDAPTTKIMEALDRALELHPEHEKAHASKGKMLQRLGRQAEALKHYRRVVAINPNNVDAAREVRVASMREEKQEKSVAKGAAAGFLGKLLGNEKPEKSSKKRG
ncbi:MAG: DnaJ domain-containing protein [Polyangiales bacterium]